MAKKVKKQKPKFISSIISVAFVLFSLGLLAFVIVKSNQLIQEVKERVEIDVFLNDNITASQIALIQEKLNQANFVKSERFISKEEAKKDFSQTFDIDVLDENPLPASFVITLKAAYANTDSLSVIANELQKNKEITDIFYQKELLDIVNTNVQKIGFVLGIIALLFCVMAITIIDNSIRLSLYSQRFLIKSMQLVGAKDSFILKPFINRALVNGLLSALLAIGLFSGLYFFVKQYFPLIEWPKDRYLVSSLLIGTLLGGLILSLMATVHSVNKYLDTKIEELY